MSNGREKKRGLKWCPGHRGSIRRTMIVPETKAMVIAMLTLSESQSTSEAVMLPSITSPLEPPRPSPEPEPAANDNSTQYSGTPLTQTPMGQKKVSILVRCAYFRGHISEVS